MNKKGSEKDLGLNLSVEARFVYCPVCGEFCAFEYKKMNVPGSTCYYAGKCSACNLPIIIEDRAAFEQEGIVTVVFS